jgi:hypothetical protein
MRIPIGPQELLYEDPIGSKKLFYEGIHRSPKAII